MTPTARYADLLLPATTVLENKDLYTAYGHFNLGITEPVIQPLNEAIDNFTLFQTLAKKMGYKDPVFKQSIEDRIFDYLSDLKGLPTDFEPLKIQPGNYIKSIYADPGNHDSSFESYNFSPTLLSADQPKIPCLSAKIEYDNPDLQSRYPLRMITPPNGDLLNSTFGELYFQETGKVIIHPEDTDQRGIL